MPKQEGVGTTRGGGSRAVGKTRKPSPQGGFDEVSFRGPARRQDRHGHPGPRGGCRGPRAGQAPAEALDGAPDARRAFDGLSYSKKQRLVLPIEGAKTAETRQRRIAKAIDALRDGRT